MSAGATIPMRKVLVWEPNRVRVVLRTRPLQDSTPPSLERCSSAIEPPCVKGTSASHRFPAAPVPTLCRYIESLPLSRRTHRLRESPPAFQPGGTSSRTPHWGKYRLGPY